MIPIAQQRWIDALTYKQTSNENCKLTGHLSKQIQYHNQKWLTRCAAKPVSTSCPKRAAFLWKTGLFLYGLACTSAATKLRECFYMTPSNLRENPIRRSVIQLWSVAIFFKTALNTALLPVSWYSRHTLTSPHTVPTCSLPAAHTLHNKRMTS